jgi:hypothetical protein
MLSRITSKRVKNGITRRYFVEVPSDWAAAMEERDVTHVQVEHVGVKGVLVLNPITRQMLADIRREKRRRAQRNRYRSRYAKA